MPSKIQVDQIAGATGSTVTLPSGQTLDLSSGTVNLPSASLSALNATNLTSGTVPSARLSLTSSDLPTVPTTKGGTGLTTLGTASQVLRVNSGATGLEFATPAVASSDFVLLTTTNQTSSVTSVSFDGFSDTYNSFQIFFSNVIPASNSVFFEGRFRRSNADVTSSNYKSIAGGGEMPSGNAGNDAQSGGLFNDSRIRFSTGNPVGNTASYGGVSGFITLHNARGTTNYKMGTGIFTHNRADDAVWIRHETGFVDLSGTGALSGFTFFFSSGNIASGNFKLYGIK
jgi:hypothetical protein